MYIVLPIMLGVIIMLCFIIATLFFKNGKKVRGIVVAVIISVLLIIMFYLVLPPVEVYEEKNVIFNNNLIPLNELSLDILNETRYLMDDGESYYYYYRNEKNGIVMVKFNKDNVNIIDSQDTEKAYVEGYYMLKKEKHLIGNIISKVDYRYNIYVPNNAIIDKIS